jgi:redox-sensitive bicupin YhaK (pirin superfamily)
MQTRIQRASERGSADYGWLQPNYYFSFSNYYNPKWMHFGALRVFNDDFILGGGKFPSHPHDNMEIVTIPLLGSVQHEDNSGGKGIIQSGDVQIMSAGSGIVHSEANASNSDPLSLFQIWVFPKEKNIKPRYDQRTFDISDRKNQWQFVVSPITADNGLYIHQNARFALSNLDTGNVLQYRNAFSGNGVFLVIIEGSVEINGIDLNRRDAIGISGADEFEVKASSNASLLAIEVPM